MHLPSRLHCLWLEYEGWIAERGRRLIDDDEEDARDKQSASHRIRMIMHVNAASAASAAIAAFVQPQPATA